jgi:DNA-directed RNA polymerase specialized sigma24 family protein
MTPASMHDARDAEDNRLLAEGRFTELLAAYFHPVRERCFLRLRDRDAGDDVAQLVFVRLLRELRSGKRYPVPFRVVVWKVVDWTLRGTYPGPKEGAWLPDDWEGTAGDAFAEWEAAHDLGVLFSDLPDRQREVLELRYLRGLEIPEIAEQLGLNRNAVDQALHNGHRKLKERLVA